MDAAQLTKVATVQTQILDLLIAQLTARNASSTDISSLVDSLATLSQLEQVEQKNIAVAAGISASPPTAKPGDLETVGIFGRAT